MHECHASTATSGTCDCKKDTVLKRGEPVTFKSTQACMAMSTLTASMMLLRMVEQHHSLTVHEHAS